MSEFDIAKITTFPRVDVVDSYAAAPRDTSDFLVGKGAQSVVLSATAPAAAPPPRPTPSPRQ